MLTHPEAATRQSARIAIKVKGKILFINPAEIVTVQANGNYVFLQRMSGEFLLRETISAVADKLQPYEFIRVRRSTLVNAAFVESIERSTGECFLRMTSGKEYTVTRTYRDNLKNLANLWVGAAGL
jgi:two-component system, LytTR family, response regulator